MAAPHPTQTRPPTHGDAPETSRFTLDALLGILALAAAFVVTASGEYSLARASGFPTAVAPAVPAALDVYALRALRAKRDVPLVVIAMISVNAVAHLITAGIIRPGIPVLVGTAAIAPTVWWRIHQLDRPGRAMHPTASASAPVTTPTAAPVPPDTPPIFGPHRPSADDIVWGLYLSLGRWPETREMTAALRAAHLPHSDGHARAVRARVKHAMATGEVRDATHA